MWNSSEDGGAFPECLFAQYPLGMGRTPPSSVMVTSLAANQQQQQRQHLVNSSSSLAQVWRGGALVAASPDEDPDLGKLAETTENTREALEQVMRERQAQEEDFSGRNIRRVPRKKPALEIALPGEVGAAGLHDPAPIVRSPTRATEGEAGAKEEGGTGGGVSSGMTVVPFSVGNWKNKRKLIIPIEQRLSQQADKHTGGGGGGGGISDRVMQLAVAMQEARKEVEAEQVAREAARQEEDERRQAEREAEATRRARELLEKTAADMMRSSVQRKKETREERLERIRLERELREREKQQEVRQRRLAKAASRLGMTVEALEADAELLKTVDDAAASALGAAGHTTGAVDYAPRATHAVTAVHGDSSAERLPSLYADDDDGGGGGGGENGTHPAGGRGLRKGVFGSAVISNEGIRREMEALAKMETQRGEVKDGIRLVGDGIGGSAANDDDDDDDDDDSSLGMDQLMKKKKRQRRL